MSLLRLCLCDPQAVYAINDALFCAIGAENPHVTPLLVARLRLWNMTLWTCPRMPPCMAVLVLFWLAEAHEGVQELFAQMEDSVELRAQMPALFRFSSTLIADVASRNITERSTVRRALQFYASMLYVVSLKRHDLVLATPDSRPEKVRFWTKGVLMQAWLAKQARKGLTPVVATSTAAVQETGGNDDAGDDSSLSSSSFDSSDDSDSSSSS